MLVKLTLGVIFTKLRLPSEKLVTGAQHLAKKLQFNFTNKICAPKKATKSVRHSPNAVRHKKYRAKNSSKKHWQKIWANICW